MCSINPAFAQCYISGVKPEQRVIADWIERVRARTGWSLGKWASEAGIKAATTVTRAVKDDYESVTKIETLHALARAAKVPSILDFLGGSAFSASGLKPVLSDLLKLAPRGGWTERDVEHLVQALAYGLGLPEADPANPASEDAYAVAARAAVARFLELGAAA